MRKLLEPSVIVRQIALQRESASVYREGEIGLEGGPLEEGKNYAPALSLNKVLWRTFVDETGATIRIYSVDGEYVEENYDVGWIGAGHHLRCPYIPDGEIWVEQIFSEKRRQHVVRHELKEVHKMLAGYSYDGAHHMANEEEAAWMREHIGVPAPHVTD